MDDYADGVQKVVLDLLPVTGYSLSRRGIILLWLLIKAEGLNNSQYRLEYNRYW